MRKKEKKCIQNLYTVYALVNPRLTCGSPIHYRATLCSCCDPDPNHSAAADAGNRGEDELGRCALKNKLMYQN